MRVPTWLVGICIITILCLTVTVAFLMGKSSSSAPSTTKSMLLQPKITVQSSSAPEPSAENSILLKQRINLVGIWALQEGGCGTGYGAVYTKAGRYYEGDEFNGFEGRWSIESGILRRDDALKIESDEMDENPITRPVHSVDRFDIIKLTSKQLTIRDGKNRYFYVKCPQGHHTFENGEEFPSR